MGEAPPPELTRRGFEHPEGREWWPVEHSEGVWFAESGGERVGPFPIEGAHREAERRNEYELVVALAAAILAAEGGPGLSTVAAEPRFDTAHDRRLAAAIVVLHGRGDDDGCARTLRGPVVIVDRFLALIEPGGVRVHEYGHPAEAERNFEVLRWEG